MTGTDNSGERDAPARIAREFDGKAARYESHRLAPWYRVQNELVLDRLPPIRGTLLDIGCGTGWLLRRALERNPEAFGVGLDLSEEMVRVGRGKAESEGIARASFVVGSWEDEGARLRALRALPLPPTVATCVSAFHYFEDPAAAVRHVREALDPGGTLFLVDRAMDASVGTIAWDLLHRFIVRDQVRFYRTEELVSMLSDAGFEEVRLLTRVRRLFWKGKLHTSLAFISARVPH
ncbi:MAG: class I SAM-dependent methyltransferase [Gemmatimonadota bacterium]